MSATYFWVLFLLIWGGFLIIGHHQDKATKERRAIAKALFARIPMRQPTIEEIDRLAKGEWDWSREGESYLQNPMAAVNNSGIRQRVRDRLNDAQRAPKLD